MGSPTGRVFGTTGARSLHRLTSTLRFSLGSRFCMIANVITTVVTPNMVTARQISRLGYAAVV